MKFAETSRARAAGVDVRTVERSIPPADWFKELAKYRFLLSPLGDGIQSSKTIEALLVLTIPIVQRGPYTAHERLVRMGFPIVIVASWEEITPAFLDHWWRELSPRLARFRHNCVTTEGYWRMITG